MKKIVLLLLCAAPIFVWAQCTTTDATDCDCKDGSSDCDLLPDITASYDLLAEPDETLEEAGILYLSVGTPNIGHGPLRVLPTDYYVCGGDTIYSPGGLDACDDGSLPSQIIEQRIYHKNGDDMSYWDREAGTMTYHPTHGHFHTDNWGNYTLRKPIDGVTDPTEWPIIGNGTKMGFCLMDLANCASGSSYGYCRKNDGTVLTNDGPNYGLGGGSYDCGINNQGISCGYLDIYDYYLDGMWIEIPEGVCNGDYYIVVEIDPNNNYLEEDDDNNVITMPYTLTEQPETGDFFPVTASSDLVLCAGETVELSVAAVGYAYTWSNGATTNTINVSEPGEYYCTISRDCGEGYSDTVTVSILSVAEPVADDEVEGCYAASSVLTAIGELVTWYDAATGGTMLGAGTSFTTPVLYEDVTYYADNTETVTTEILEHVGETEHAGSDYSSGSPYNGYQVFDVFNTMTLKTVKVITDYPGERIIELRNASEAVLQSIEVDIPEGTTVIDLNFVIEPGTNYQLGSNDDKNDEVFGEISPFLKRSTEGTNYPYTIDDIVSVTGTSFDGTRWYYFYDWEVEAVSSFTCSSERIPVTVKVVECTGISEVNNIKDLNIYPNPSNGTFTVSYTADDNESSTINVLNTLGEVVATQNAGGINATATFNINAVAAGTYTVEIVSENKAVHRQIVIE
ncbi:MAG: T9SS type A sorting domain-containing protein [Chitinophagales bacterium]